MEFRPFEHAAWLAKAWVGGAPVHDLGASAFKGPSWADRLDSAPDALGTLDAADWTLMHLDDDTPLRAALARRWGLPDGALRLTAGTTGANTALLLSHLRPGCNVVCERPTYAPLAHLAEGLGAEVRYVDRDADWRLRPDDVADRLDDDTALVLLTSPNNPTGAAASAADLRALGDAASAVGAHVLVDQVYRELTDHPVAAHAHPHCYTTAGFNKTWGAAGLRTGWMAGDAEGSQRAFEAHRLAFLSPPAFGVRLGARLLEHEQEARAALEERLVETHGVYREWCDETGREARLGESGLTAFPEVADGTAEAALSEGLLVVPGEAFGMGGYCRVGLGIGVEALREGLRVLGEIEARVRGKRD